ncbi:baseplate J/gp47 family protein [Borrelia sp. RT1S]|uniref:baseplate J/gp47 family protein n=1 Tax=Borrelia sp. RT1S TaxID=2898580 RepID=UPI001E2AAA0C|nr:baseplate J/gp47 family protein [Borrelia sp. RT1S]UGQ17885.1 baseplate J/gp47 family protein [Borrelia sp. RT1S]
MEREFVSLDLEQKIREDFFKKAAVFGIGVNSNSKDMPILNLILGSKLDIRNETYSVGKNYDIRVCEAPFLDMEACKIGVRRHPARRALLICKIVSSGNGELNQGTIFYYADTREKKNNGERLEYKTLTTTKFTSKGNETLLLEAQDEGDIYNLATGTLMTDEFTQGLTHLEITGIKSRGEDEEEDDVFRARILREINGLTLRDTISYYKRKLESGELIREVLIKRKGVNNTEFILRPHVETTTVEEMKKRILASVGHKYEVLEKIDYSKASKKRLNIKLKQKDSSVDIALCKARLQKYINSLSMGASFSLYSMYSAIGDGVNIIEPQEDQKASENEYWDASITVE